MRIQIRRGQEQPNATLTDEQAIEIRRLAASGVEHKEIAARFGVKPPTVWKISKRLLWKHV